GNFDLSGLYWAAGDDWHGVANADVAIEGRKALITIAEDNGTNQWQGQVHFNTGVAIEEGQAYDFSITFKASQDYSGVTVKPHPEGDDAHFFSEGRHDLSAYDEVMVQYINCLAADYSTENLIITLDFPGSMAGTTIEVKDIIVQKHK
ncbi:MAG: carbohydrate binding domain-containing protein, partial [Bacteroidales bacterium]|nr:carbohydrate binding domain-containing protein [Bacteroidales bacterium]